MTDLHGLFAGLQNRDNAAAYACFLQLIKQSAQTDAVYAQFDLFVQLMRSENAFVRTRGLLLIAANARWDVDYRIDEIIDEYLTHVADVKPTVARQLIAVLPELARVKRELASDIRCALQSANPGIYRDSMAPLIQQDIAKALEQMEK